MLKTSAVVVSVLVLLAARPAAAQSVESVVSSGNGCEAKAASVAASLSTDGKSLDVTVPKLTVAALKTPGLKRLVCQFVVAVKLGKKQQLRVVNAHIKVSGDRKTGDVVAMKHYLQGQTQTAAGETTVAQNESSGKELDLALNGSWTACDKTESALVFNISERSLPGKDSGLTVEGPVRFDLEVRTCP